MGSKKLVGLHSFQRDNICFITHEFVQTYKVCLRVTQPSGGSFPLAVFIFDELLIINDIIY